jgi:hypothetical protein
MAPSLPHVDPPEMEALLFELLDMPISFYRCFVTLTGKVTAALLLSYLWWTEEEAGQESDNGIARPLQQIRDETGLSKEELGTARRVLRDLAILHERRHGIPPVVEFRLDRARVAHLLVQRVRARQAMPCSDGALDGSACGRLPH